MIYFTSDTHFCHANVIHLNQRPFVNIGHMNEMLIKSWNDVVTPEDEIYILGDFMYKGSGAEANEILTRLNGKKYLIRGNHDDSFLNDPVFDASHFEWIKNYYVLHAVDRKFILFHFPILEWDGYYLGWIHLYGHVHTSTKNPIQKDRLSAMGAHSFHVGIDVNNFKPLSIHDILAQIP